MNKTAQNIGATNTDLAIFSKHPIGQKIPFIRQKKNVAGSTSVGDKCNGGFTLIELMITLFVAIILAGVAVPNMQGFAQNSQISSQTNDLVADLNFARSEAIKRGGSNVLVCKSNNSTANPPICNTVGADPWENGRIIFVDANNDNGYTPSTDTLLRVRGTLNGANTLRANAGSTVTPNLSSYIAFTRSGLTTLAPPAGVDPPHHFKLCDDRGATKARGITISTTGRTKIVRGPNFTENLTIFTLTCP